MHRTRTRWTAGLLLLACGLSLGAEPKGEPTRALARQAGPLVIVGGGGTVPAIQAEVARLLGEEFRVAVLPQASAQEDRGQPSLEMWLAAGAKEAVNLTELDAPETRKELELADLIWFPGGAQTKLVEALEAADLVQLIRERHRAGVMVGGTSAGAAVIGELMISGSPEPASLHSGAMKPLLGLGLWPEALIDQHFIARNRNNRLLTAVLDHPKTLGVGIDEQTAIFVQGDELRVVGEGCVIVYDARRAEVESKKKGEIQSGTGLVLHVLSSGMSLRWREPK